MHRPLTTQTRYKRTARFLSLSFSYARAFVTTFARCNRNTRDDSVRARVSSCVCVRNINRTRGGQQQWWWWWWRRRCNRGGTKRWRQQRRAAVHTPSTLHCLYLTNCFVIPPRTVLYHGSTFYVGVASSHTPHYGISSCHHEDPL